jgi:hypothetical protein
MPSSSSPTLRTPWFPLAALVAGLATLARLAWIECSYYTAPLVQQALDDRHGRLRSSGSVGLLLGLAAAALIVVNLAYLVRRRLLGAAWLGGLRGWLDLHVVSGLLAGGCVALHAAGHLRSASATVASGALAIVLLTGLIGRYVLAQIPRTREGRELSLDEARARFAELRRDFAALGLPPLEFAPVAGKRRPTKLGTLARVLFGDREARASARRYRALLAERSPDAAVRARVAAHVDAIVAEAQSLARLDDLTALIASWRFLHRWLALVMVGTAACHVALALRWSELRLGELSWRGLWP